MKKSILFAFLVFCYLASNAAVYSSDNKLPPSHLASLVLRPPFTLIYRTTVATIKPVPGESLTPPQYLLINLSAKGNSLLLTEENLHSHVTDTYIWKDNKTFTYQSNSVVAEVYPGYDPSLLLWLPIPALGLPNLPLATYRMPLTLFRPVDRKSLIKYIGNERKYLSYASIITPKLNQELCVTIVPDAPLAQGRPQYTIGTFGWVLKAKQPQIKWMTVYNGDMPTEVWEFTKNQLFQGLWLGSQLHYARYFKASNIPSYLTKVADYQLVKASEIPLDNKAFNLETYINHQTSVNDYTDKTAFTYLPGEGSLDQQKQRQQMLGAAAKSEAEKGNILARSPSGVFLALALLFAFIAWAFRNWRARQ